MAWHPVQVVSSGGGGETARYGATMAAINAQGAKTAGELAILRVGSWPNRHEEWFYWDPAAGASGLWVARERIIVTQSDGWAMDLSGRTGPQMLDWSYVDNAIPFGKAQAIIQGGVNLASSNFDPATSTGVINVDTTASTHSYPFRGIPSVANVAALPADLIAASGRPLWLVLDAGSGTPAIYNWSGSAWVQVATITSGNLLGGMIQIRDNFIRYTGITTNSFTGCSVIQGSRENIPAGEWVVQGSPGAWGFQVAHVPMVASMYAAGARLQERLDALMNNAPANAAIPIGEKKMTIAAYWNQYSPGDGSNWPWPPAQVPPVGGMGVGIQLQSLDNTGGSIGGERNFYLTGGTWTDWALATPTKEYLIPRIVGKMEAGAIYTGSTLDTKLTTRWVASG